MTLSSPSADMEWKTDAKDKDLTKEKIELVLDQAKLRLKASIGGYDSLARKASFILGVAIPLSTAVVAFLIKEATKNGDWHLLIPLFLYLLPALLSFSYLRHLVFAVKAHALGYNPRMLLTDKLMRNDMRIIVRKLLKKYCEKIESNETLNTRLGKCLDRGIICFLVASLLFLISYSAILIL